MTRRRHGRDAGRVDVRAALLALAAALALGGCDQAQSLWERVSGGAGFSEEGPARLDTVPLEARALSGAVQPQDQIAALLAPEPVMVAPGEILVGARVEPMLVAAAEELGLPSPVVRALRGRGFGALRQVPDASIPELLGRAEAKAGEIAVAAVRDELRRLGAFADVTSRPGGTILVALAPRPAPAPGGAPASIEWNDADRCPRFVIQGAMEQDATMAMRCALQVLRGSGRFAFVEPNYVASAAQAGEQAPAAPREGVNDPLLAQQWALRPRGAEEGASPGGAGFFSFWRARQTGSRAVRVALVDSGIDRSHSEFRGSATLQPGVDLISDPARARDNDGVDDNAQDAGDRCDDAGQDTFHGSQSAGVIGAAADNRVGIAGANWGVTIQPVRVLGRCGGTLYDVVAGLRWAAGLAPAVSDRGAPIVNRMPAEIIQIGLTMQAPCPASLQAAIDIATARNAVIVVPAGNKADQAARYAPANCNNVVVVGASDARGELAFYSNFGPQLDVLAPGGDLFADTDGDLRPDGILTTRATQIGCYDPINQNSTPRCFYGFVQGTSAAASHVTAALALLAAQSGLRGRSLENALFTRAVTPFARDFGRIECARSRNATPTGPGSSQCARPAGRGHLDLTRAARTIPQAASP